MIAFFFQTRTGFLLVFLPLLVLIMYLIRHRYSEGIISFPGRLLIRYFPVYIYIILLSWGIIRDILSSNLIVSTDERVARFLEAARSDWLTAFFLKYTLLGKWEIIVTITVTAILLFILGKMKSFILPLIVSIAGSEIFTGWGKVFFHRPRPDVAVYHESTWSFPSGHATAAAGLYGFLFYALIRSTSAGKRKAGYFITGIVLITLLGFSRLYLGVHFLSDVWGGYLSGALWLMPSMALCEYLLSLKREERVADFSKPSTKYLSQGLVLTGLSVCMIFAFNYHQ